MSDPASTNTTIRGNVDANGSAATGAPSGYPSYDNIESLATAAHAQTHQPAATYASQAQTGDHQQAQQPPHSSAAVDPMFYLTDPPQATTAPQAQQQQYGFHPAQQFGTAVAPQDSFAHQTPDQWRHAIPQGASPDLQQLLGSIHGYTNPPANPPQQQQMFLQQRAASQPQQLLGQQQQHRQYNPQNVQHHQQLPTHLQQAISRSTGLSQTAEALSNALVQQRMAAAVTAESSGVSSPSQTDRAESAKPSALRTVPDRTQTKTRADFRPKTAIPQDLTAEEYSAQCIQAAISSRLSPYALHRGEYEMLRKHINHLQVTTYLHIRNGILRLWQRNPLVSVTREEAAGCAKDYRFFDVADVAYDWLVRNGYINFGCIEVPSTINTPPLAPVQRRKTIVVIGAGMSGLGCARQLEGLIAQYGEKLSPKELPPQIIVLEGRGRIGGRIYSHPLKNQAGSILPADKRVTADLGAQVITGFDNGNPLGVLIRGQLALGYHSLKDNSVLYDSSGSPVDKERDGLVERLFNDILDRVSVFKQKAELPKVIEGDRELIDHGKDPSGEGGKLIAEIEDNEVELPTLENNTQGIAISGQAPFTAGIDKLTGKPATATGSSASIPAAEQARKLGWELKPDATGQETINLTAKGDDPNYPTLGKTMDNVLEEYRRILELTPQDLRMVNWHYANLEYANATNVSTLSLGYWDQDDGQEFAGAHAMLKGGYTQVPRGLYLAPTQLDVRSRHVVKKISYQRTPSDTQAPCQIVCENGQIIDADQVVVTLPLGVLKTGAVEFDPPLPDWKTGAIERLGFGLLNKVVLAYDEPFWDVDNDMVGLLRNPVGDENLHQSYEANRGRFYMFWNVYKTSGKPVLVALMAGDAAEQTEREDDDTIIADATAALQAMYPASTIPAPTETIITRWRSDPFSRGSYSYVGASATGDDYDHIAKPVADTLFFAGEATCKSHPATVHGAYISGLRAASEVITALLGEIQVPTPLIPPKPKLDSAASSAYRSSAGGKRKAEDSAIERAAELKSARLAEWESRLQAALTEALGERPVKPGRSGANPFLIYQKDHWFICKAKCDEARRTATGNPEAKATRNEVRAALGQMWREAPAEEKAPYLEQTERNKEANAQGASEFKTRLKEWDQKAARFREEWKAKNPSVPSEEEVQAVREAQIERAEMKRSRKLNGYLEDSEDEEY